ncbi:hypothetical protein SAMN02910456_01472 [Ruminococcaceae bacterium YRB3002]|nr:hypothetical protein SAMN02910456_01472 [Ruminococcaceae bacterium YRB3002]
MKMSKVVVKILVPVVCTALLTGCYRTGNPRVWELPSDPVSYETETCAGEDPDLKKITVGEREYMIFGSVKDHMYDDFVDQCLGYIGDDTNMRIYTVNDDRQMNYLITRNVEENKDKVRFWRASDTAGMNIDTPYYIVPLGYDVWSDSGIFSDRACVHIRIDCTADDIASLTVNYSINGESGSMTSGGPLERRGNHTFDLGITDKTSGAFKGDKFPVRADFIVTTEKGNEFIVRGGIDEEAKLDYYLEYVLSGSARDGYRLTPY